MYSLDGSVTVVTGSTRGIGETIAKRLAEAGVAVVVSGRTESDGKEVVRSIEAGDGTSLFEETHVRKPDKIAALMDTIFGNLGSLIFK